jgi:hypothetical protein
MLSYVGTKHELSLSRKGMDSGSLKRVLQSKGLRRMRVSNREEVTGGWS